MEKEAIMVYFILVNVLSFILSGTKVMLINYKKKVTILQYIIDWVIFLGGGIGSAIIFLGFERMVDKKNFSRFLMKSAFLFVQILYLLSYFGPFKIPLQTFFKTQLETHSYFIYYFVLINLLTAAVFAIDKISAMMKMSRVREVTLFLLSLLGGSLGAMVMMFLFRHKIRNVYFFYGIPCIFVIQILLVFWFYPQLTNF